MAHLELSVSMGPSLPKRKWVATATVASPTTQVSEAIAPKPREGVSVQGTLIYPFLNPQGKQYQLRWSLQESMCMTPSEFIAIMLRDVQRDPPYAAICSHALGMFGHKVVLSPHLFYISALQHHGKWAHPSGSSDTI